MKTVSTRDFVANPQPYLDMARQQDVRVGRGQQTFRIVYEPTVPEQPLLEPDDDLRNSISGEELLKRIHAGIERIWAERRK